MKRFVSLLLAICLLAACLPLSAWAAQTDLSAAECMEIAEQYWDGIVGGGNTIYDNYATPKTFNGKKYYYYTLQKFMGTYSTTIDYLFVEVSTGDCYFGVGKPEYRVITVRFNEELSLAGTLRTRTKELLSGDKMTSYVIEFGEAVHVRLFDSSLGYHGESKEMSEMAVEFKNSVSDSTLQNSLGKKLKVKGLGVISNSYQRLTLASLYEAELVSDLSESNSTESSSLQQEFYFNGTHIATITLPESWKGHLFVEKGSTFISFYSLLNTKNEYGGRLFTIGVQSDKGWENWPRHTWLRTFSIDGKSYDLILWGPTDVRHDHNDPACREEWLLMEGKEQEIIDNIVYHIDSIDEPDDSPSPFSDVFSDDYYKEAVEWAVEQGITNGTGNGKFSPNAACTRAQIVTFLWRAAGSPEPTSGLSMFSDVEENEYYGEAVRWAIEQGITNGTGNGKFSPEAACTRGQAVTFLWRAAGEPSAGTAGFSDVYTSDYYAPAVNWAVQNDVTAGTGNNRFSPNWKCTRAQIVTFLYRYAN